MKIYNFGDRKITIADPLPSRLPHRPLLKKFYDEECVCGHARRFHVNVGNQHCFGSSTCNCQKFDGNDATNQNEAYAGEDVN